MFVVHVGAAARQFLMFHHEIVSRELILSIVSEYDIVV